MKFSVFQVSRIGGREINEDRMGYCYTRESGLFVLADGMGGHPEGEVAAQLALQTISALYQKEARPTLRDPVEFLSSALLAAHQQILRYATEKGMLDTPRTTLVAAVLQGTDATWVHCGDSRLYLVRGDELLIRTRDHSYLEQQSSGVVLPEQMNRNILFTCLGSPTKPIFDMTGPLPLFKGDKLLLCSDGVADFAAGAGAPPAEQDAKMLQTVLEFEDPGRAAFELVVLANRVGGYDNISCVVLAVHPA